MSGADGALKNECFDADRIHLSAAGYRVWGEALGPVFTRMGLR
jgi:lysophospholipase L1-like esterase